MTPTVRRVEVGEPVTDLVPLVEAHVRFERSPVVVPRDWAERAATLIRAGAVDLFVARATGVAVGWASLTREVSTWTGDRYGHLDCLFVDAAWRGAGTGWALLRAALDHAAGEGLHEVQWQTPTWNAEAIAFYRRAGATPTTKERFVVRTG